MPLRLSALFFRILRYFFHSFVAAKQKKEMLPLMILSNHFETAPFSVLIIRNKDDSVAGAVLFTDEWKLVELDSELKPSAVKF